MCHSISSSLVPIVSICAQLVCLSQINPPRHKYRRHETNNGAASWRGCSLSELLLRSERFSPFLALMYLSTKKKKWSGHPVAVFKIKHTSPFIVFVLQHNTDINAFFTRLWFINTVWWLYIGVDMHHKSCVHKNSKNNNDSSTSSWYYVHMVFVLLSGNALHKQIRDNQLIKTNLKIMYIFTTCVFDASLISI